MQQKIYKGNRAGEVLVETSSGDSYLLPLCLEQCDHSPTGFAWGYGGSGPAQLAFAILYDYFSDKDIAFRNYQQFKWEVISKLKQDEEFTLTDQEILGFFFERKETCNVI